MEVARALEAAKILDSDGVKAKVVNMSTIKPIDSELIKTVVKDTGCIVTAEDHNIIGGLGSAVAEVVSASCPCPIEFVGVKDTFGESGDPHELAEKYCLTAPFIAKAAMRVINRKKIS